MYGTINLSHNGEVVHVMHDPTDKTEISSHNNLLIDELVKTLTQIPVGVIVLATYSAEADALDVGLPVVD